MTLFLRSRAADRPIRVRRALRDPKVRRSGCANHRGSPARRSRRAHILPRTMLHHSRLKLLTATEERELARRIEKGDLVAKEQFLLANIGLVGVAVHRVAPSVTSMEATDLVQEGVIGLMRAVEKFDWRKGHRFSTYASPWISQALQRALIDRGPLIRIPDNVAQRQRRLLRQQRKLSPALGREPTFEELLDATRPHRATGSAGNADARGPTVLTRHCSVTMNERSARLLRPKLIPLRTSCYCGIRQRSCCAQSTLSGLTKGRLSDSVSESPTMVQTRRKPWQRP